MKTECNVVLTISSIVNDSDYIIFDYFSYSYQSLFPKLAFYSTIHDWNPPNLIEHKNSYVFDRLEGFSACFLELFE